MLKAVGAEWNGESCRNISLDKRNYYGSFTKETLKRKLLPWKKVSENEIEYVKTLLLRHFAMTAESDEQFARERKRIEETWSIVRNMLRQCPGLVRFMLEIGAHSRFFYPFLLNIPRATAMLPAFLYGMDIFGKIVPIPSTDPMYWFCLNDPVFKSVRFRNEYEQKYLMSANKPLTLAGGLLPPLWTNDYALDSRFQKVTVYDPDTDLREPLRQIFGDSLVEHGIDYRFRGFKAAFTGSLVREKHDFISAMGLMSYFMPELETILAGMLRKTNPGDPIIFDFQLLNYALLFDKFVLHWETESPMKPMKNADEAVKRVSVLCDELGAELLDYAVEPEEEAGVVFRISKAA